MYKCVSLYLIMQLISNYSTTFCYFLSKIIIILLLLSFGPEVEWLPSGSGDKYKSFKPAASVHCGQ